MRQLTSDKLKISESKKPSISAFEQEEIAAKKEQSDNSGKVRFECPKCHWIMRSQKPDDNHPIPSVAKPNANRVDHKVMIQNCICRNPRCKEAFVVYWSDPKDFFNRL